MQSPSLPSSSNAIAVLLWAIGIVLSPAFLVVLWKAAMFFATGTQQLKLIPKIEQSLSDLRDDRSDDLREWSVSLTLLESDVNELQEKVGVPLRDFPDRRVSGVADRRRQ